MNPLPKILAEQVAVFRKHLSKDYVEKGWTSESERLMLLALTEAYRAGAGHGRKEAYEEMWVIFDTLGAAALMGASNINDLVKQACTSYDKLSSPEASSQFLADISKDGAITP